MNAAQNAFADIAAASKRVAQRAIALGENRLELLMVEVQEARQRLLRAFLLALGMAVFGLLAGIALTIGIIILFWESSPLAAVAVLVLLYSGAAVFLHAQLSRLQRDWEPFPATLGQLRKDCECLGSDLR